MGAARGQGSPAVNNWNGLPLDALANDAIVIDEKTAFGDVLPRCQGSDGVGRSLRRQSGWRRSPFRQSRNRVLQLLCQFAAADHAIAFAVQRVLAGPVAENHRGMRDE